jgi:hypothetical protein
MADPPTFSVEQARLVLEAAGLDASRPLTEQTEAPASKPAPVDPEHAFAQALAARLAAAQSPWFSSEADDGS